MPIKKIRDLSAGFGLHVEPCRHPDHYLPGHLYLSPGEYEHTCSGCGAVNRFVVERPILGAQGFVAQSRAAATVAATMKKLHPASTLTWAESAVDDD